MMEEKENEFIEGKIVEIRPYGAILEFEEGKRGLLHISEISDQFIRNINSYLHIDEVMRVKILSVDEKNGFLKVSLKQVPVEERTYIKAKKKREFVPKEEIDATELKEKLPEWIEEAKKED